MLARFFPYKALILVFALFSAYILFRASPTDYLNITYLYSSLVVLVLGFYYGKSLEGGVSNSEEQKNSRVYLIASILIFAFGAALRFYGLNFGLPHNYHPDEIPKVNAVMRMYTEGTLDPNYFLHPSMLLYSTYFSNYLFHLLGADGSFADTAFIAGRTVSAIAGSLSIWLLYFIGKEIFSKKSALLASLLLAVSPVHVTCSRYLKEDSLLVFFILLTLLFSLIALRKDNFKYLFLSAFFAGLSASTKYSGALSFAIIAALPWLKSGNLYPDVRYFKAVFIAGFFSAFGFFAATPYSIINSTRFFKDVGYESMHMTKGHTTSVDAWSQYWMYHLSRSIIPGTSSIIAFFTLFRSGQIFKTKEAKPLYITFLLFLFYLSAEYVKSKPAPQPERYILPAIPFMALLAGSMLDVLGNIKRRKFISIVLVTALVLPPLLRVITLASEIHQDTRVVLNRWIEDNLPPGTKILTDRKSYAPLMDESRYEVRNLNGSGILQDLDVKNLRKSGFNYLILSSLFYGRYFSEPKVEPIARERIRSLSKYFKTAVIIRPKYGTYGFHNPTLILLKLN